MNDWPLYQSADQFQQPCPRCGELLSDRTAVEVDQGMLFYRVRFVCRGCGYWLCTRLENFCLLGPVPRKGEPAPAYLSEADQRIRHDLTQMVVRQLMPAGVESYEAGRVWLSGEKTVTKTWSEFSVGGLHLCLANLAQGYFRKGDAALGTRAMELAVEALRSADKSDPALSDSDPENHRNAARILADLAGIYWEQGRQAEAYTLLAEARGWAPELFESKETGGEKHASAL
jgi:tetratricopeptide (TPR) repeat protein